MRRAAGVIAVVAGVAAALATGFGAGFVDASALPLAHHARADVNGDGRPDLVSAKRSGTDSGRLSVQLTGGASLSVRTPSDAVYLPGLVASGSVDGRPGAELFVDVLHVTTEEEIGIYTLWRGALRSAGRLPAFGEDDGIRFGITCTRHRGRPVVIDHVFTLRFSARPRYWTRQDTVYGWSGPRLRALTREPARRISGAPPAGQVGVACGRAA